jgi:hypothetical protein
MITNAELAEIERGLHRRAIERQIRYRKIQTCFDAKQTRWDRWKFFFGGKFDTALWITCGKLADDAENAQ